MPSGLVGGAEAVFSDNRLRLPADHARMKSLHRRRRIRGSRRSARVYRPRLRQVGRASSNAFVIRLGGESRTIAYNEGETRNLSSTLNFTIHSDRGLRLPEGRRLAIPNEEQSNV